MESDVVQSESSASPRRRRPRMLIAVALAVAISGGALVGIGSIFGIGSESSASAATRPFGRSGHAQHRRSPGQAAPTASQSRTSAPGQTTPPQTAPSQTAAPVPSTSASAAATAPEAAVAVLVNAERAKAGCAALTVNAALTQAARAHSTDMATRNYFSHDTPEGVPFSDRITAAGYSWSGAAENIAMGQADAASVMDSWMNSAGHKANILNCGYKDLGVGVAANAKGQLYWTQDFASAR